MQLTDSDDQELDLDNLPVLPPGSVPSLTPPETPPATEKRKRLKNNAVLDQRVQVRIPKITTVISISRSITTVIPKNTRYPTPIP